ncbi:MAG: TolC family protein [Spirochaetaceae bacterium]|jgi:outer membrane protein TolC|nr:TolC family protein [Spirochaetaceae bacterium]
MTKRNLLFFTFIVFQVFCLDALVAEETAGKIKLSPNEAVELAIKNNLTLEIQRINTDTKKRASDYVWNKFLPTVGLSGGVNLNSQNSKTTGDFQTQGQTEQMQSVSTTGFQGQVQAQLAINFALFEGIKSLKLDYETGLLSLEQAKLELERDVRKTYYNIMLLEKQAGQQYESLRNTEEQAKSAESQYRAGRQPELSYLQARVNVETMKPSIDQAANGLRLAKSNFAMTLGLPLDTDFELSLPVDGTRYIPLDTKELVRQAKDNNPDILVQKQQLRTLLSQRKAQVYQKLTPNLSLGWTGGLSGNGSKTRGETNLSSTATTLNQDALSTSGVFTIGLSWTATSLLPFSVDSQSIKDMDNNIKTLSISIAYAEQGAELDINNKVYSLEQIRASIEAQRATAELAERSYNETLRAYNNGLQSLLQVQNSEEQLRNARLSLYQQESNYLQGLIDLEYSIGVPFGTLMTQSE